MPGVGNTTLAPVSKEFMTCALDFPLGINPKEKAI